MRQLLVLVLVLAAFAQTDTPTFRAGTRLVDVVVIAKSEDKAATGLTKDDFTLRDNGKPQTIAFFSVKSIPAAGAPAPTLPPGAVSNRLEQQGETSLLLLALAASAAPRNLELRIQPESMDNGVPQAFIFSLVNVSDHDVRVPSPAVQCENSFVGSISLKLEFTPDVPGKHREGRGCAGDMFGRPSIMERVQKWLLLRSGESLTLTIPHERLYYDDKEPGIYEFWADYAPPSLDPAEREQLQEAGIDFPRGKLTSNHVAFRKAP